LIYGGVSAAYPFGDDYGLIMDIGGGSVEFILANKDGFVWKQSFPIGVAVLYNEFHQSNPMSATEIDATNDFLEKKLQPLFAVLKEYPAKTLIGASGTFDVLEKLYVKEKTNLLYTSITTADAYDFYHQVKDKTEAERLLIANFAPERNVMIVVAMVLMVFVIEKCKIEAVVACAYAMKEGILKRIIAAE
jgi:exopolyphosphatase/guanosine-5'-triphosphate,3'-diphosphate pyrophosphatase